MRQILTVILAMLSISSCATINRAAAFLQIRSGDSKNALEEYNVSIAQGPRHSSDYNNRGIAKTGLGDYGGAIEDFNKALEPDASSAVIYLNRAVAKMYKGDYRDAIGDFNECLELNPGFTADNVEFVVSRFEKENSVEETKDPGKKEGRAFRLAAAYCCRGNFKNSSGNYSGAVEDYDKSIALEPGEALFYSNLGDSKKELGDFKGAIKACDKAIELDPDLAAAYSTRGYALEKSGDKKGALNDLNAAVKLRKLDK